MEGTQQYLQFALLHIRISGFSRFGSLEKWLCEWGKVAPLKSSKIQSMFQRKLLSEGDDCKGYEELQHSWLRDTPIMIKPVQPILSWYVEAISLLAPGTCIDSLETLFLLLVIKSEL